MMGTGLNCAQIRCDSLCVSCSETEVRKFGGIKCWGSRVHC